MFTAFRFGIPAVYGEVGGPPIRLPRNPAPVAANNPPTAGEADNNPPIQIPPPNHHDIDHNDGGNVRKFPTSLLVSFHHTLTTSSNTVFLYIHPHFTVTNRKWSIVSIVFFWCLCHCTIMDACGCRRQRRVHSFGNRCDGRRSGGILSLAATTSLRNQRSTYAQVCLSSF